MARVTVEDCIEVVENRFELVALAAERAKRISAGAPITVSKDNDKFSVIALREIACDNINIERLRELLAIKYKKNIKYSMNEEEITSEVKEEVAEKLKLDNQKQTNSEPISFFDDVEVDD